MVGDHSSPHASALASHSENPPPAGQLPSPLRGGPTRPDPSSFRKPRVCRAAWRGRPSALPARARCSSAPAFPSRKVLQATGLLPGCVGPTPPSGRHAPRGTPGAPGGVGGAAEPGPHPLPSRPCSSAGLDPCTVPAGTCQLVPSLPAAPRRPPDWLVHLDPKPQAERPNPRLGKGVSWASRPTRDCTGQRRPLPRGVKCCPGRGSRGERAPRLWARPAEHRGTQICGCSP